MTAGSSEDPRAAQAGGPTLASVAEASAPTSASVAGASAPMSAEAMLAAYDYELPEALIAQHPPSVRTQARLLPIAREDGRIVDAGDVRVGDIGRWLRPGDLLVVNATRVISARLRGHKASGGRCEALLLDAAPLAEAVSGSDGRPCHRALVKSSGRLRVGLELIFDAPPDDADQPKDMRAEGEGDGPEDMRAEGEGDAPEGMRAEIVALSPGGTATLAFEPGCDPLAFGEAPLPPYIRRPGDRMSGAQRRADLDRYQTVFAREPGAVAAPTAGLHLTHELLDALTRAGIERAEVVLHVGLGTFRPLRAEDVEAGRLHRERYELPEATASAIARARARGGRVIAVGTTTTRVLEHCADGRGGVHPGRGETDLFLKPGSPIRVVDGLLTNFHLPGSSLLMLVAAFIGHGALMAAYRHAVRERFRFFSYGDAMLVLPDVEGRARPAPANETEAGR